ncbi:unnamed protein product, partial [Citrullus colocynthis]
MEGIDGRKVLGNHQECCIKRIGTIQVKMFDNQVRELDSVRKLKNGLYIMEGNSVAGTSTSASVREQQEAKMWHQRLAHTFYEKEGIQRYLTLRGAPQQKDLVERMNKTLLERVKCSVKLKPSKNVLESASIAVSRSQHEHVRLHQLKHRSIVSQRIANVVTPL